MKKIIFCLSIIIAIIITIVLTFFIILNHKNISVNMQEDIWKWPEEIPVENAVEEGCFVIDNVNQKIYNKNVLNRFVKNTSKNSLNRIPDKIKIVVYNMSNEPAVYDLEYKIYENTYINEYKETVKKSGYILITDNSRINSMESRLSYEEQIEYHKIKTNDNIPASIYGINLIENQESRTATIVLSVYTQIMANNDETLPYKDIEIANYGLDWEIIDKKQYQSICSYNNPIVPTGFKKVETENASWKLDEDGNPIGWNKGLVIEDENKNQFVWVPVKNKDFGKFNTQINSLMDEEKQEEIEQIEKYQGFYIARYEAGVTEEMQKTMNNISKETNDIEGIPVSKKDVIPWNYISLKNAKKNAQKMINNEEVRSDLVTTRQWLYIMKWLDSTGYNIDNPKEYGNFVDSRFEFTGYYSIDYGKNYEYGENKTKQTYNMILSTGASERNITNNIYDIAGNLIEYTDGYVPDRGYYSVGGHFDTTSGYGIDSPKLIGVFPLEKLGFRVVLYMK